MKGRGLALMLVLMVNVWLVPGLAHADQKIVTLNVKGMVCQA
jgi:hypothetical protein